MSKMIVITMRNDQILKSKVMNDDVADSVWADICYGSGDDTIVIPINSEDQIYVNRHFMMYAECLEQ